MSSSDYTVKLVSSETELRACYDVRMKVFTDEQGFDADLELDEHDCDSIHFVVALSTDPSHVVGTVRYCPYPYPTKTASEEAASIPNALSKGVKSHAEAIEGFRLSSSNNEAAPGTAGAKLGRLALLKETRGKKLGEKTVREAESWIEEILKKDGKVEHVEYRASAQMYAIGFYEKLGYEAEGEPYDDDGQPHKMCRKIVSLR